MFTHYQYNIIYIPTASYYIIIYYDAYLEHIYIQISEIIAFQYTNMVILGINVSNYNF